MSALRAAASAPIALAILIAGSYLAAVLSRALARAGSHRSLRPALLEPVRRAAALLLQERVTTERPDALLGALAPAIYAAVAAAALSVVPLATGVALADTRTGIVIFGAAEALAIVAVFLRGWTPNSHLPLIGGFRFVALALSYELLSMFVLIAAALPAESLEVSAIVESQAGLWNVIRQPLGLPLWLVVTWGVTFTGPLNLVDSADLGGGGAAEISGRDALSWQLARGGMLTVFSAMGAAVFLGGWHGPWLPGAAWMIIKTAALMALVIGVGQRLARVPAERAVLYLWTIGLPLSFVDLLWAGLEALA